MSEKEKKDEKVYPKDARDIFTLLKKMQGQLDAMDKKIDALAKQSRPSKSTAYQGRQFGKPYKEHDRFSRSKPARPGGRSGSFSRDDRPQGARPFAKKKDSAKGTSKRKRRPFDKD